MKGARGPPGQNGFGLPGSVGEKGNQGVQGAPGIQGSPGTKGSPGIQGDPGFNGANGAKGVKGRSGNNGVPGINGLQGDKGAKGQRGFGQAGDQGERGVNGLPGDNGTPGFNGSPGAKGFQGLQGDKGVAGSPGTPGAPGTPGFNGAPGLKGFQGAPGAPGAGFSGQKGEKGIAGAQGSNGSPGFPGSPGAKGLQGLPGGPGPIGNAGDQGNPGFNGNPGLPGDQGPAGLPGQPGTGSKGLRGDAGAPGVPGQNGRPGSDASDGFPGVNGVKGQPGLPGEKGFSGNPGSPGFDGSKGAKGNKGQLGDAGNPGFGPAGQKGEAGGVGFPGSPGGQGPNGIKGERGAPGAFGSPGSPGFPGTKGERGDAGGPGPQGEKGFQGQQGVLGTKGVVGQGGFQGVSGQQGLDGQGGVRGPVGPVGQQGAPGQGSAGADGQPGQQGPQGAVGPAGAPGGNYIDECQVNNGGCHHLCVATFFSHYCACHPGYTLLQEEQPFCEDIARPGFNGAGVDIVVGGGGQAPPDNFPSADVAFLVDGSIRDNFNLLTSYISELIGRLKPLEGQTRFSVLAYDTIGSHYFTLNQYPTISQIQAAVLGLTATRRGTANLAEGLKYANDFLQDPNFGARFPTNKLVVLFSVGNDRANSFETRQAVQQLRTNNIQVVVIAIGSAEIATLSSEVATFPQWITPVTDLNSLAGTYPTVIRQMNQAAGVATDLVDPPTLPADCANKVDVALLIDASSSTMQQNKNRNYAYIRIFAQKFVANLGVSYMGARVGIVVFSNYASVQMTLDQTWDLDQVQKRIRALPYIGGDTNIANALNAARTVIFNSDNGDRFDASNIAILITDAWDNVDANQVEQEAQQLRNSGATLLGIGITKYANMERMSQIVTSPEYAIQAEEYDTLQTTMSDIISLSCQRSEYFPRADIAVVLDVSDNVDVNVFSASQSVYNLLSNFGFGPLTEVRMGVIVYGRFAEIKVTLSGNIDNVLNTIRSGFTSIAGSGPGIEGALDMLIDDFFTAENGDRPEAPNVALFFTAGGATVSSFLASANLVRSSGVGVVAIGVSSSANFDFLSNIAMRFELALPINSYNSLSNQQDTIMSAAKTAVGLMYVPHWRPYIPRNQLCYDTYRHGIQCFCWNSLKSLNATQCVNIDECSQQNGGCSHSCIDTDGSYFCGCPEGLTLGEDARTCEDVNECDGNPCSGLGDCHNTYGGYFCLQSQNSFAAGLTGAESIVSTGMGSLVGATVGSAIATIVLMVIVAIVVRTVRNKQLNSNANGLDNPGFRGNTNATMKASTGAFDDISVSASSMGDADSLASF